MLYIVEGKVSIKMNREISIQKLKNRNKEDFRKIYLKYYKLVHYVSLLIVKDEQIAEDIMQDTFVSFMNHIEEYEDEGKVKQYLTTISRNLSLNYLKKKSSVNETPDEELLSSAGKKNNEYGYIDVMLTLKNTLSLQEANIVSLKVLFNYSFKEIAEDLNLTLGTVQSVYYRSIDKLKEHFEKEGC